MAGKTAIKAKKAAIITKFAKGAKDTGSPEVQIALLTNRIVELTEHFKVNKKDHHGRRGLIDLVSQRRKLLTYLKSKDSGRYGVLINALELRK